MLSKKEPRRGISVKEWYSRYGKLNKAEIFRRIDSTSDYSLRLKLLSNMSKYTKYSVKDFDKWLEVKNLTRYNHIRRNKKILDKIMSNKYKKDTKLYYDILTDNLDRDISISVYTIKAILNSKGYFVVGYNDVLYKNDSIYKLCIKYWKNIWWDTDTGIYSKETLAYKEYDPMHEEYNKVKNIREEYVKRYFKGNIDESVLKKDILNKRIEQYNRQMNRINQVYNIRKSIVKEVKSMEISMEDKKQLLNKLLKIV